MTTIAVTLLAGALALAGCGDDDPGDGSGNSGGRQLEGELATGQALYDTNCAACHGADLDGSTTGPPLRSIVYEPGHHPDSSFRQAVAEGVEPHHWDFGPMPPIPSLGDDDIDAIIAYVRHRQEVDGFID